MNQKKQVLAIAGSTRNGSVNHRYLQAISKLTADTIELKLFEGLTLLPHFNPDLDTDQPPVEVADFRHKIKKADGVLICTPEYAMGVPGSLKNAIDWTVSSCEFSKKAVALITAGTSGLKAHASLLGTLHVIEANVANEAQMIISFARTKLNAENEITDVETVGQLQRLLDTFVKKMNEKQV